MTDNTLIERVRQLVDETERTHRYSMSRIYGLYNEVFEVNEKPQSCASCLLRKTRQLKDWLNKQPKEQEQPEAILEEQKSARKRKSKKDNASA